MCGSDWMTDNRQEQRTMPNTCITQVTDASLFCLLLSIHGSIALFHSLFPLSFLLLGSLQLEEVKWRLNLQMAQASQSKVKRPNALFQLVVRDDSSGVSGCCISKTKGSSRQLKKARPIEITSCFCASWQQFLF